jgi:PAS domain-containing protein
MIGTVQDATELRQAKLEMRRLNRALRTLSLCNTTLVHAVQEQTLVNDICRILTESGGYRFVWVGHAQNDEHNTIQPVAHAGHEHGFLDILTLTWSEDQSGQNPAGYAIRSKEAFITRDIVHDAQGFADWRMAALERGYVSVSPLDGSLLQFNQALCELLGYDRQTLAKKNVFDLYADTEAGLSMARQIFERFLQGESVRDFELQMRHCDSHPIWVTVCIDPVFDESGKVIESRSSVIDISTRKQAEEEEHRVAELAIQIGSRMGLDPFRLEGLRLGATIHYIGKIAVPSEILNRPDRLDPILFNVIKAYPTVGYDIICGIEFPWPLAKMVAQHHERLDGRLSLRT